MLYQIPVHNLETSHLTPVTRATSIGRKRIYNDAIQTPKTPAPSTCKRRRIATRLQFTKSPAVQVQLHVLAN